MFFLYSALMGLAAVALTPYWLVQSLRHGKYLANLGERLGFSFPGLLGGATEKADDAVAEGVPAENLAGAGEKGARFPSFTGAGRKRPLQRPDGAIWLHAVSVGEVLSSVELARRLKAAYPERPLIISTTTSTGQALARERMTFADGFLYFPLDLAFAVRRALAGVRPAAVVIVETEIWPNFLREAAKAGVPVAFVSGRISDRSFARYQKYFGLAGFYLRPLLRATLGFGKAFLMQSETDAERIRELGAPGNQ